MAGLSGWAEGVREFVGGCGGWNVYGENEAPVFERFGLAFDFIFNPTLYGFEGVQVFDFDFGTGKAILADFVHRNIYLATHLAFLHVCIRYFEVTQNLA